jgi:pilus assembly protein Flp/PilA
MLRPCLCDFIRDESGATAIEYALIAGIVSLAIVGGLTAIKPSLVSMFESVGVGFQPSDS